MPANGKHVPSLAPNNLRDLSKSLARHRAGNDARPTVPPGGWPATAGKDPDAPASAGKSDRDGSPLTSPTEGVSSSTATSWHPVLPGEYAGY